MDQHKVFKYMERFWLVFAIFSLLFATWFITKGDFEQGKFPLFTAFCGGVLFGLRRYQRRKFEKAPEEKNKKS
jgi:uncharacterized membrane protein YozB (DUF420 family)